MLTKVSHFRHLASVGLVVGCLSVTAEDVPSGVIGGVVRIAVPADTVRVTLDEKPQLIIQKPAPYALIPLSLDRDPGEYTVAIHNNESHVLQSFTVLPKEYPAEYITLDNQRQVEPNPDDLVRIGRDAEKRKKAYDHRSPAPVELPAVTPPVKGRVSGTFGSRRFFNNQPRNPHSGVDYAAPTGTPIVTPMDGEILVADDWFFNGNVVMIDHGGGLVSMMCHLDKIDVEVGQRVSRGQPIGTVGSTGRSTGPHLHWSLSIGNTLVDPVEFMRLTADVDR